MDSHSGTNASSEVVDESTDQSDLEAVNKVNISVNVAENPETQCESEVQITQKAEETSNSNPERNKSDIQPMNNTIVPYTLPDGTICKAQVLSSQSKKSGKWKDWINVKVVGQINQ